MIAIVKSVASGRWRDAFHSPILDV